MALCLLLLTGCGDRPAAPVLRDEPVYQHDQAGFRFLVPPGWSQRANASLPAGRLPKEVMLVQYRSLGAGKGAQLEVTAADLPPDTALGTFLAGPAFGVDQWKDTAAPQKLALHGVPATRYQYAGRTDKQELVKEVVAVERPGGRTIFFTGLYAPGDTLAREQIRRIVDSTIWKN